MTPAEIAAALRAAKPGEVVTITGIIEGALNLRNVDLGGVVLDTTQAELIDGAVLNNVKGFAIRGGIYGRADMDLPVQNSIVAANCEDFSIASATVLGNGDARGGGISIATSARVTVRECRFDGHNTALGVRSCTDALVTGNSIRGSTADGINITDCQRAIVSANDCRDFRPAAGAHPDAIQMRSLAGRPLQADIWLINNIAIGRMQGFFGGEFRTHWHGNYAAANGFTHTVTASKGRECSAFDNVLSNTPDAENGPGSLKGFTDASNSVGRNLLWDARGKGLPPRRVSLIVPPIWNQVGSRFESRAFNPASVEVSPP